MENTMILKLLKEQKFVETAYACEYIFNVCIGKLTNNHFIKDDLRAYGVEVLSKMFVKYDLTKSSINTFITRFVFPQIECEFYKMRNENHGDDYKNAKLIKDAETELLMKNEQITKENILKITGLSEVMYHNARAYINFNNNKVRTYTNEENETDVFDTVTCDELSPSEKKLKKDAVNRLYDLVKQSLSERDYAIIMDLKIHNMKVKDVALKYKLSEESIRLITKKLENLKQYISDDEKLAILS